MKTDLPELLAKNGYTLGVAESLTGGLLSDTFARLPEASDWFKGGVVAYGSDVKRRVLHIGDAPIVSKAAAVEMADQVAGLLRCDVAVAVTGVGGPGPEDGIAPGTVWMALHLPSGTVAALRHFPGEPADVIRHTCQAAVEAVRDALAQDQLPEVVD
ncbi:MAG: nicotinamide-nucleotide amidase [Actinomycetota bacterium]|jgi:nicotinamide-nucleotide amidase